MISISCGCVLVDKDGDKPVVYYCSESTIRIRKDRIFSGAYDHDISYSQSDLLNQTHVAALFLFGIPCVSVVVTRIL